MACDPWQGIVIEPVHGFLDNGPDGPFPYRYSHGDITFKFNASYRHEWRIFESLNDETLKPMHTATYITENSIKWPLNSDLKRNIEDGMLALVTNGGFLFHFTPDFRLEFVGAAHEIPKSQPRPSDLTTVPRARMCMEPVALGSRKNTSFVFKGSGAHDSDKGITIFSARKLEEIALDDPTPYIYSDDNLIFEFRASQYRAYREYSDEGSTKLLHPHTATYVIEESIRQGAASAKGSSLTPDEYDCIRRNIREGMWITETLGGYVLSKVPEFRLEFVDNAENAPKWPPRPQKRRKGS